jgi:hypothetical protein
MTAEDKPFKDAGREPTPEQEAEILGIVDQERRASERWIREEVTAGHGEYLADPSKGIPATEILGRIKARRAAKKAQ